MKKTLRTLIGLFLALAVTTANAVPIGCTGLEGVSNTPAAQSGTIGN